jgi:dihydroceramidase
MSLFNSKPSTVDWCEKNHIVLPFIAEFWNSMSSLCLMYAGYRGYLATKDLNGSVIYLIFVAVGLGSVLFHSVLSVETQMLDEIPMIFLLAQLILNIGQHANVYTIGMVYTYAIFASKRMYNAAMNDMFLNLRMERIQFYLFQFSVIFISLGLFLSVTMMKKNNIERELYAKGCSIFLVGWGCWLCDYFFCENIQWMNLHAWWHLFSAISVYQLSLLSILRASKDQRGVKMIGIQGVILPHLVYTIRKEEEEIFMEKIE